MAATDQLKQPDAAMNSSISSNDREAQISNSGSKRGGWITFPFLAGTVTGLTVAGTGWSANLIVYLIEEFNIMSIDAAQIVNVLNGCTNLFPVIGAIIADSFFGSFSVISVSSVISLLSVDHVKLYFLPQLMAINLSMQGTILLALTASLNSLRPPQCEIGSSLCKSPSKMQFAILYGGLALGCIGLGGGRFTLATMGANQFNKKKDQGIFFNWYFFAFYVSSVISSTAIVYIQDNVSWTLGISLCIAANFVGLVLFLLGKRFYLLDKPNGSPFTSLARVIVATLRKRKLVLSSRIEDYYQEHNNGLANNIGAGDQITPKKSFRFLNRAALKTDGDIRPDGSIAKPWRVCTVQQVEDLKTLIRIFPLWSSSIFLSTTIGIVMSLTILQALIMDRHLGPSFRFPAGSILVIILISTSLFITLIDRLLIPTWQKLTGGSLTTPLQQVGVGHVLNLAGMVVSALVESKRLKIAHANHLQDQPGSMVPMLAVWLFPQLVLVGIGEAFHFPGQVALYYQEFPVSLRSTSTAMIALIIGIGFYLTTAIIDLVRRVTDWLPENLNNGRLDNVYWTLVVIAAINFGYYVVCSMLYKYRNVVDKGEDDISGSNNIS
ncbi:hypothetical protein EZV62_002514 [Acer yangbiense]|uniref:Uncharacterized protein n=1 Tax=Acer yangbiense TaxID=1000413 RepID=A0A5C7IXG8_9ROSI|nr:hypothetical protein EZV62_002514 [Acer yangbiense]